MKTKQRAVLVRHYMESKIMMGEVEYVCIVVFFFLYLLS